jgi:hypothetical protein
MTARRKKINIREKNASTFLQITLTKVSFPIFQKKAQAIFQCTIYIQLASKDTEEGKEQKLMQLTI